MSFTGFLALRFFVGFALSVLLSCPAAFSQSTELTVRLYSLHPEHRLKLEAATGHLAWRSCEKCQRNTTNEISIEASGQELKITGEDHGGLEQLFVEGSYRLQPEQGLNLTLSFPVHI